MRPPSLRPRRTRGLSMALLVALLVPIAALVVGAGLVATAGPAGAHAVLIASDPGNREQLVDAPERVELVFSERVDPRLGGIRVIDTAGNLVSRGDTEQPTPEVLAVQLEPDLPEGTYVANYRVISADGHPVGGSVLFSVGAPVDEVSASGVEERPDPVVEVLAAIARFLSYLGAFVAAGTAFFAWYLHDRRGQLAMLRQLVLGATVCTVVAQLVVVWFQAALATGDGFGVITDPGALVTTVSGNLGWSVLVVCTAVAVATATVLVDHELFGQVGSFYALLGTGVGFALWGHALESTNTWLTITSDAVHGLAAGLWFGGLVALSVVLVARIRAGRAGRTPDDDREAADAVDTVGVVVRFSTAATIAVTLLALAGVALAWSTLGSVAAFVETTFGRVLLVKLGVAGLVGALALFNHLRLLPAVLGPDREPGDEPAPSAWDRLNRIVRAEALGLVVVLAVTGVLVGLTPPTSGGASTALAGPFNDRQVVGTTAQLDVVVTPALVGTNAVHLQYLSGGRPADIAREVTIELRLPDQGIGPLEVVPTKSGIGHWQVLATDDFLAPGTWELTVVSRLSEFEQLRNTFEVPITE